MKSTIEQIRESVREQAQRLNRSRPMFRKGPRRRGATRKVVHHLQSGF